MEKGESVFFRDMSSERLSMPIGPMVMHMQQALSGFNGQKTNNYNNKKKKPHEVGSSSKRESWNRNLREGTGRKFVNMHI